jgi:opacity protein-like surface antigen
MSKNTTLPKGIKSSPLALLAAILLWAGYAQAQQSVNSSGGNATGSEGTVSYSIGQVVYTTNSGNDGSLAQGVQQAYEIIPVGINENEPKISLSVFPNPIADNLILQVNDFEHSTLNFQLCDMQGKQISKGQIIAKQTQINTTSLSSATYFINVVNQENQKVQTFKIIKN